MPCTLPESEVARLVPTASRRYLSIVLGGAPEESDSPRREGLAAPLRNKALPPMERAELRERGAREGVTPNPSHGTAARSATRAAAFVMLIVESYVCSQKLQELAVRFRFCFGRAQVVGLGASDPRSL